MSSSDTPNGAPMRMLVCTPKFAPQIGGAETWLRALLRALTERGQDVSVLARSAPGLPARGLVDGIDVRRVAGGRMWFSRAIGTAVRDVRPDVVVAHYSALAPSVWAAHRAGRPAVGIVHDVYGWRESVRIKGPVLGTLRHAGLERSLRWLRPDAFLVNSAATAGRLRPLAGGRPVTVVPAGADHLPTSDARRERTRDVVFVGRLVHQKGAGDLIDAIRALAGQGRRVRTVIVGAGPQEDSLRHRAESLDVHFAGRLDDEALDEAIRGAALLALPSTREGWGLAITEAAARGVPYVAYDIPAVREQHEVLQGGVLVPADQAALSRAIAALLDDDDRRTQLGETGRRNAQGLRWSDAAAVAEQAMRSLLSERSTAGRGAR